MNKLFTFIVLWMMSRLPTLAQWLPSDSRHLWVPISWENGAPVLKK